MVEISFWILLPFCKLRPDYFLHLPGSNVDYSPDIYGHPAVAKSVQNLVPFSQMIIESLKLTLFSISEMFLSE